MGGIVTSIKNTGKLLTSQDAFSDVPNSLYNMSLPYIVYYGLLGDSTGNNIKNLAYNGGVLGGSYIISPYVGKYIPKIIRLTDNGTVNVYVIVNGLLALTSLTGIVGGVAKDLGKAIDETGNFLGGVTGEDPTGTSGAVGSVISPFGVLPKECKEFETSSAWDFLTPVKMYKYIDCQNKLAEKQKNKILNDQYKKDIVSEMKKGYVDISDMKKILKKNAYILKGTYVSWSLPEIKTWYFRSGNVVEYIFPSSILPYWPSQATTSERNELIEHIAVGDYTGTIQTILDTQARVNKETGKTPTGGELRSTAIRRFIQQFKDRYPIDLGDGLILYIYDDRVKPPKKYSINISPIHTRLPPPNLSNDVYSKLAELVVDGKEKEYMQNVVSLEQYGVLKQ